MYDKGYYVNTSMYAYMIISKFMLHRFSARSSKNTNSQQICAQQTAQKIMRAKNAENLTEIVVSKMDERLKFGPSLLKSKTKHFFKMR